MPNLKTYSRPQVQERSVSGATYSANANAQQFGAGVGRAIGQVGQMLNENAMKMKAEDDQAKVKEALNEFRTQLNNRTYLDEDAYYNRKGLDAYETFDSSLNEFQKMRQDIAKNLKGKAQQDLFNQTAEGYITNEHEQMSRYASAERNNWRNGQDQAVIEQAAADGSLRYLDNGKYADQITLTVESLAKRNGWSDEEKAQKTEEAISSMHSQALDNLFVKNPSVAKDYYDTHKEAIAPALYDDIEAKIEAMDNAVWVEEQAAEIRLAGGSRSERLAQVNELTDDPEKRKALRSQIQHDLTQERYAEQEAQATYYNEADLMISGGMSIESYKANNLKEWQAMTPAMRKNLESLASSPAKATETNLQSYYEIRGIMATGDMEAAREYLVSNVNEFSNSDFKSLTKEAFSSPKGSTDKPGTSPYLTAEAKSQFNDWVETTLGKEPSEDGDDRKEWNKKRNSLYGMYEASLNEGSDMNSRRQLLDQMSLEQYTREKKNWIPGKQTEDLALFELPQEEIDAMTSEFDSAGIPMTAANVNNYLTYSIDLSNPEIAEAAKALTSRGVAMTSANIRYAIAMARQQRSVENAQSNRGQLAE